MKLIDRIFGCLMILGGIGHGFGSYLAYKNDHITLLWAWCASFAGFLLAAINLLRAGRQDDRPLAWISLGGCLVWIGFVVWFGQLLGNPLDFRPLVNLIITVVLAGFSIRSLLRASARIERAQPNAATARAQ
ncbi:MAG TPA: hypothetical protein VMH20_16575 [Verrucomicrobiae bacterium]|nr:hypothetical protein [Verrucomicrobiae bacterium]